MYTTTRRPYSSAEERASPTDTMTSHDRVPFTFTGGIDHLNYYTLTMLALVVLMTLLLWHLPFPGGRWARQKRQLQQQILTRPSPEQDLPPIFRASPTNTCLEKTSVGPVTSQRPLRLITWPEEKPSPFPRLPVELILEIAALLPPYSQLLLALTCKSFLRVIDSSGALRRSIQFQRPKDFYSLSPYRYILPTRALNVFYSEWWKLLRHLEDSRWRCCSDCLKLHPTSEFTAEELARSAEQRTCILGPFLGVVQLCPCINLTFRDKRKLVARMMEGKSFRHECSYNYDPGRTLFTRIRPLLQADGDLIVQTEYTITNIDRPTDLVPLERLCCPHRSIFSHIMDAYPWPPRPYLYPTVSHCRWCPTWLSNVNVRWRFDLAPGESGSGHVPSGPRGG